MLLSVVIITYNHAPFIERCIGGVLAQKVDFTFEIIIADDCSTDGTTEICEHYAAQTPAAIRLIKSDHNLGAVENEQRAFEAAKGKYVATCEGDDWWDDPMKLQKQVSFLESHPDYSVCFHRYRRYIAAEDRFEDDGIAYLFDGKEDIEISMHQFMHRWCTQYLTMVFRRDCYDTLLPGRYKYFRDTHQVYHLMLRGRCRLFAFCGGVYNITRSGVYTTMSGLDQARKVLAVDREIWKVNRDNRWKQMCAIVMQDMIDRFKAPYAFRVFGLTGNVKKLIKNMISLL